MDPSLRVTNEEQGCLVVLEFDHGRANEVGRQQIFELARLVDELEQGEARAMLTWSRRHTPSGKPVFSAGADVKERRGWDPGRVSLHVRGQRRTISRLAALPLFHVCVVNGLALGWGTEYLLACDYVIATPEAMFGLPETGLGIVPGAGGTARLWARVGRAHALRMGMTGERIGPDEALRIGLVHELAPDLEAAMDRARRLCGMTSPRSPTAMAAFKAAVLASQELDPGRAEALEMRAYEVCIDSGDAALGRESFEEIIQGARVEWSPRRRFEP